MGRNVEAPFPHRDGLGESPFWDAASATLVRVDSERGAVHRLDPVTGEQRTLAIDPPVGFAVPASTGQIIASQHGTLRVLDESSPGSTLTALDPNVDPHRFNDGKCDAAGRLFTGTLDSNFASGGGFYRIGPEGTVERLLSGITVSNGMAWDDSRSRFYYIDSTTQQIDVFDYDLDSGVPSDRRSFVEISEEQGLPDGMEVDSEGGVWVVLFRGATIHRYDPDGSLSQVVTMPTSCPTSIAFGGPELRTAYVTSSLSWLDEEQRRDQPLGGAVFTFDAGVSGRPTRTFSF